MDALQNLIISPHKESLCDLILEYLILEKKIQHKEAQCFYFRKGIDNQKRRLKGLMGEYEKIRNNFLSLDQQSCMNEKIQLNLKKESINRLKTGRIINKIAQSSLERDIAYCDLFLVLFQKDMTLYPLKTYAEDAEKLIELMQLC